MSFNWDRALQKANDLEDDNLSAALQLADRDGRWEALLRPPEVPPGRSETELPLIEGSQRHVMCPDLYRATLSGSINRVDQLLRLTVTEEITRTNDEYHDVEIQFEDIFESNGSHKQLGARVHGYDSCTLQEVTAEENTVLHIAAEHGHLELAKHLIRNDNTLLTSQNSRQETPLHLAARAGNHRIISLIVLLAEESGVGTYEVLMKRSTNGDTVLHEAARHGHEDVVQVLMTVAPSLSAEVNNASMSPLYLAVFRKSVGVVKALLESSHSSAVGPNQQNALHVSVLVSREITSVLIDWKVELAYGKDASGSTPLHYAASNGDITIAGTTVTLSAYGAIFSPQRQDKLKNWKDEAPKWIDRTSTNLIIVSVLIATIAFSAAFNVPGSYNDDGVANLRKKAQYNIFVVLDTIALSASVSATMLLVVAKAVNKWGSWTSFSYSLA
ncbi:hypothetical protein LUZ61_001732 [Rhynchospora tenuis]|uniref:PGG domain-containing protein n=1 Tax=Rhynchospora tenuis TaxID=198213 RepID=A0AAD5ZHJ8_9POAL|nr:hypothetical protein LUZ61_001732 [Rhynchospora tenuis]